MALLLDRQTIIGLVNMDGAVGIIEQAFAELANGSSIMPQRTAETDADHNGWYAFMPAQLKEMGALGIKTVTVYKDNPSKHDLPSTLATIVLLDGETGKAVSVMDGGYLTAVRTGAVTGLATKHLARADASVAGVLGAGVQARAQLLGMAAVRKLDRVLCFSQDPPEAQQTFASEMSEQLGIPVDVAGSGREVIESVDILSLATTAATPILDGDWIKEGTHINAIGSHAPGVRELDTRSVVRSKIVCDQVAACLAEAGDIQIPIEEGAITADDLYGELGELVTGQKQGRENDQEITLFKSVGLSIQDISIASSVYNRAVEAGVGTEFNF
ncbi:MAG: ornithine cyclodeaminase family protein [SAR202 cluster bacterium]|jgi:ornithine cyclodeaminase/alanine dehydrogenase|nr:ornithine cyclodeaminase family protein [SAR202 cluster bacterium]MDP6301142.1 ornithine cyclodeaminase family protein [SAR202 cluster bacterium]MDP7103474.1 ornithine cyclodeaminase family protein [SAR202 cluster bacterium]MDP7226381.1 ornithine cyclodeaminase family protein [SAR202 cluster bacterium]MDP7415185.1 ornithine cyclodeaminase family protein [SAR202 cluster bacterium]|tara:strand:+ start:1145 stop:2131 length:987 start_codon:yes stop_codon:yes gene_type:complete